MLVKCATLWLFTIPLSPCNLFYRVHNVVFNACSMYACSLCMYVKYTLVCIPHRDIYHTLSGMVRSINTIQYRHTHKNHLF